MLCHNLQKSKRTIRIMTQEMVMACKKARQMEEDRKHGDQTTFTLIRKKLLLLLLPSPPAMGN